MSRGHGASLLQMSAQVPEMANPDAGKVDDEDRARHHTIDVQSRAQRLDELGRVFCGQEHAGEGGVFLARCEQILGPCFRDRVHEYGDAVSTSTAGPLGHL